MRLFEATPFVVVIILITSAGELETGQRWTVPPDVRDLATCQELADKTAAERNKGLAAHTDLMKVRYECRKQE